MFSVVGSITLLLASIFLADTSARNSLKAAEDDRLELSKNITQDDSLVTAAPGPEYKKGAIHRFLLGTHYRKLWAQPMEAPLFRIHEMHGGMYLHKVGGSQQTLSLKLKTNEDVTWALRTVNKNQSRALPDALQNTLAGRLFRDQASALHPMAALVSASLAESAGLLHSNPEFYFVPYDTAFGEVADKIQGHLAMLEENPDESWENHPTFDYAEVIMDTDDLLELWYSGEPVEIDHREYAKCRLLDILVGDWDRHAGQWEWAGKVKDGVTYFRPIIRDRDAAFYKYNDGLLNKFSLLINPKFTTFEHEVYDLEATVFNGLYLDRMLLTKLSRSEWQQIASELKASISDNAIHKAVLTMPEPGIRLTGADLETKLKSRRDAMEEIADDLYELKMQEVVLTGTDDADRITLTAMRDSLLVSIIHIPSKRELYYFNIPLDEAESLEIFALGGNDTITLRGTFEDRPKIKLPGGTGADYFSDEASFNGLFRPVRFIDTPTGNRVQTGKTAHFREQENLRKMDYDRSGDRLKVQ